MKTHLEEAELKSAPQESLSLFEVVAMTETEAELPPAPWDIISHDRDGCFEVRASTGEHVYIYYEDDPARRAVMRRFSRDQAKRIALLIAKLPEQGN